jgi:hypothetical protein
MDYVAPFGHWGPGTRDAPYPALCCPDENINLGGRVASRSRVSGGSLVTIQGILDSLNGARVCFNHFHDAARRENCEPLRFI